jgi:micrococcal nuclease
LLSIGDGDTLRVDYRGKQLTIRLACIDAPEIAQDPFGAQSRSLLASLAPVGSEVSLRVVDIDRYRRTVAEVSRGGQNVNLRMVRRGQAFAYRQYLSNCDPTAYLGVERGWKPISWGGVEQPRCHPASMELALWPPLLPTSIGSGQPACFLVS